MLDHPDFDLPLGAFHAQPSGALSILHGGGGGGKGSQPAPPAPSAPPPAPPPPPDPIPEPAPSKMPDAQATRAAAQQRGTTASGARKARTLLTGPSGISVAEQAGNVARNTLLGG